MCGYSICIKNYIFFSDTADTWTVGDFCMAVWDNRDGKLYDAKIWEIKNDPYQNRQYAVVEFEGVGAEHNNERSFWLSDLKPSMKKNLYKSSGDGGINKLHPFNLHPEK